MSHRWIGSDDCSQCLACGIAICDDADRDYAPPCYGPDGSDDAPAHHFIAAPVGIECAYGDCAIGPETEWASLPRHCIAT
jgi:hypothetical protein